MGSVAEPVSVRFALRAATHRVHERLHGLPMFARLLSGALTRQEYTHALSRLYGFHKPLEDVLRSASVPAGAEQAWSRLARVHRLEADLLYLGVDPGHLPRMAAPAIRSSAGLLGALYVREGSTLGGQVLARRLDILFGDRPQGRTFLAGDPNDAASWRATCAALERHAGDLEDLIAAAERIFGAFEAWFEARDAKAPYGDRR